MEPSIRSRSGEQAAEDSGLFVWRSGLSILIGQVEDERWVLARGWLEADTLSNVRRWSFADPVAFARQVGRLSAEVGDSPDDSVSAARSWALRQLAIG